jgi:hypothetical protein
LSLGRYALIVMGIVTSTWAVAWLPVLSTLSVQERWAAFAGAGLATLNTVAAYALVLWSQPRSTNVFLAAVLGGMLGRMAVMLVAVVAAVLGLGLPKVPLVLGLLAYFVLFLVLELTILHRRTSPQVLSR